MYYEKDDYLIEYDEGIINKNNISVTTFLNDYMIII